MPKRESTNEENMTEKKQCLLFVLKLKLDTFDEIMMMIKKWTL